MATKKILCLLIAAAFFCSFGLFSFADDDTLIFLTPTFYAIGHSRVSSSLYFGVNSSYTLPLQPNSTARFYVNSADSGFIVQSDSTDYWYMGSRFTLGPGVGGFQFTESYYYQGLFVLRLIFPKGSLISFLDFSRITYDIYISDNIFYENPGANSYLVSEIDSFSDYSLVATTEDSVIYELVFDYSFVCPSVSPCDALVCIPDVYSVPTLVEGYNITYTMELFGSSLSYSPVVPDPGPGPDDPGSDPEGPNDVQQGLDYEEQKNEQAYGDAIEGADTSTFDLSSFATSFTALFNGLNYQGTDFRFVFPGSGVVPALNMQLWPETEIPFRQWIDRMPAAWLTIARFLAWFGLAWAFIHKIRALIQDINGGDEE